MFQYPGGLLDDLIAELMSVAVVLFFKLVDVQHNQCVTCRWAALLQCLCYPGHKGVAV